MLNTQHADFMARIRANKAFRTDAQIGQIRADIEAIDNLAANVHAITIAGRQQELPPWHPLQTPPRERTLVIKQKKLLFYH